LSAASLLKADVTLLFALLSAIVVLDEGGLIFYLLSYPLYAIRYPLLKPPASQASSIACPP
jgi:hypothetical protein